MLDKGENRVHLNKISYVTNIISWKEGEKILDAVKTKRKYHANKFRFYGTVEKKLELFLYIRLINNLYQKYFNLNLNLEHIQLN